MTKKPDPLDPRDVLIVCFIGIISILLFCAIAGPADAQSGGSGDPDWLDRAEMVTDWLAVRDHADDLFDEITTGLYDPPTREWLIHDYLLPAGLHIVAAGNAIQATTPSSEPSYLQYHLWLADRHLNSASALIDELLCHISEIQAPEEF